MFLPFVLEHGGRKAEMCVVIDGMDQSLALFLIYTSVLATRLASKNEEKTLRAIHPSCYFGDVYLTILNIFRSRLR